MNTQHHPIPLASFPHGVGTARAPHLSVGKYGRQGLRWVDTCTVFAHLKHLRKLWKWLGNLQDLTYQWIFWLMVYLKHLNWLETEGFDRLATVVQYYLQHKWCWKTGNINDDTLHPTFKLSIIQSDFTTSSQSSWNNYNGGTNLLSGDSIRIHSIHLQFSHWNTFTSCQWQHVCSSYDHSLLMRIDQPDFFQQLQSFTRVTSWETQAKLGWMSSKWENTSAFDNEVCVGYHKPKA